MATQKKGPWIVVLIGSLIGMISYASDLIYHNSMDELGEALGTTFWETSLHVIPVLVLFVLLVVAAWQIWRARQIVTDA